MCLKRITLIIFFMLSIYASSSSLAQADTIIAVDASTSMRGFFTTGEIHRLIDLLKSSLTLTDVEVFCYKYDRIDGEITGGETPFEQCDYANGQITLLNRCYNLILRNHREASIIYLITDNVQDPEGSLDEQGDINLFYDQLRSKKVVGVHIFPLILDFDGPLFRRDGFSRLSNRYVGKRGLVIYSILLKNDAKDTYFKQNSAFGRRINFNGISAKLIEGETVSVFPIDLEFDSIDKPEKNRLIIKQGDLVPHRDRPFSEGEPIVGVFKIGIRSKLNYVKIDSSRVKVELYDNFKFFGLGSGSSDFIADDPEVRWDPMILEHAIIPGDFEVGKLPKVRIELRFDRGVRFSKSPGALWRYMKKSKAGDFRGTLLVKLGVLANNIQLVDQVKNDYSISGERYFETANENVQSRILNLDKLFKQTIDFSDILAEKYAIHFKVNYPSWPLFLFIFLLLALISGTIFLLNRRPEYKLIDIGEGRFQFESAKQRYADSSSDEDFYGKTNDFDNVTDLYNDKSEGDRFKLFPFVGGKSILLDGLRAAKIIYIPIYGVIARARRNFIIDENKRLIRLDPISGTTFMIDKKEIIVPGDSSPFDDSRTGYSSFTAETKKESGTDNSYTRKDKDLPSNKSSYDDYPEY